MNVIMSKCVYRHVLYVAIKLYVDKVKCAITIISNHVVEKLLSKRNYNLPIDPDYDDDDRSTFKYGSDVLYKCSNNMWNRESKTNFRNPYSRSVVSLKRRICL